MYYGPEWAHPSDQPMPLLELVLLLWVGLELVNPNGLLQVLMGQELGLPAPVVLF